MFNFKRKLLCRSYKHFFYLKINRDCAYSLVCLQNWIDIINNMDAAFCIICDNKKLKYNVKKKINFYSHNAYFIKSYKKQFKSFINNLCDKRWINAANAHLSTYWHAKRNKISSFWNIDADDTMFLIENNKLVQMLTEISRYADEKGLNNFSLDMWRSRTAGKQWSFGITYTNMNIDYFSIMKNEPSINWKFYRNDGIYLDSVSIDCYFSYCKDVLGMKNETFYIENSSFIHWGDFLLLAFQSGVYIWKENYLYFPILQYIFNSKEFAKTKIASDCIRFSCGLSDEDNYVVLKQKLLYSIGDENIKFLRRYFGI